MNSYVTNSKISHQVRLRLKCAILFLLVLLASNCKTVTSSPQVVSGPRIVAPQDVPGIIHRLPSYTRFSYDGLVFFNDKLYASSNIGLLEFEGTALAHLYKWYERDDVVSGPWVDVANNSLWILHNGIFKLIHYDGKAWERIDLPEPEEGYTRGDLLAGFRGTGTPFGFWLEGGGSAWQWESTTKTWKSVSKPPDSRLARLIPQQTK